MNGPRTNQLLAPTSFITSISRRLEKMESRIVFAIRITDAVSKTTLPIRKTPPMILATWRIRSVVFLPYLTLSTPGGTGSNRAASSSTCSAVFGCTSKEGGRGFPERPLVRSGYCFCILARASEAETKIDKVPHVQRTQFISKEKGLKSLREQIGKGPIGQGITQLHGQNPLPLSIIVHPDNANNLHSIQQAITPPGPNGEPKGISPGIQSVSSGQGAANTIRTVTNAVKIILSVIAVLLLIASLMLVANTIRLSIYARRREVEVMRLVGATNWFIRWPFVIEGLLVGLSGAAIACGMLWLGKVTIIDPLAKNFELIDKFSTVGFVPLIIVLLVASVVVSALGSGITLRRFLRV